MSRKINITVDGNAVCITIDQKADGSEHEHTYIDKHTIPFSTIWELREINSQWKMSDDTCEFSIRYGRDEELELNIEKEDNATPSAWACFEKAWLEWLERA